MAGAITKVQAQETAQCPSSDHLNQELLGLRGQSPEGQGGTSCRCALVSLPGYEGPKMELGAGQLWWLLGWLCPGKGEHRTGGASPHHPGGVTILSREECPPQDLGPILSDPEVPPLWGSVLL